MAKLTKTEAIERARDMARTNADINALTAHDIVGLDYQQRRVLAAEIQRASSVAYIDTPDRYMGDVVNAFERQAFDIWLNKERALTLKRKAWQRALTSSTLEQAKTKVVELLTAMHIRGMNIGDSFFGSFSVRRADEDAALYVRFNSTENTMKNPDDETQTAHFYTVQCELSWSSTGRSLARSAVAIKLYSELLDAANEITQMFEREQVVSTWGVPETVAEAVQS